MSETTARGFAGVRAAKIIDNPSQEEIRGLSLEFCPNVFRTEIGSINKVASIAKARSAGNTYIASDDPSKHSAQAMPRAEAARIAKMQDDYLAGQTVVRIDGYIGNHPDTRVTSTLWISIDGANVAGMQQILYFPVGNAVERAAESIFNVIYTPGLSDPAYPQGRVIVVDVDNYVTRIIGSDYFGESKKAGLRMLNAKVYRDGGLVLHAGAKNTPVKDASGRVHKKLILVMGESGTGKTTSTFSPQGNPEIGFSEAIQDDMLMVHKGGKAYATENGCFAISSGLRPETEPIIYRGSMAPDAWLENVYMDKAGHLDFLKEELTPAEVRDIKDVLLRSGVTPEEYEAFASGKKTLVWTKNGRTIIPMSAIETAGDSLNLPPIHAIGVLNRNTNVIPAVVHFHNPAQAAAYFMLGETMGTAASGADAGKAKRSPFTNPFFPLRNEQMANRYMELAATMPSVFNFMMNTGWVGGDETAEAAGKAMKVKIRHSSAILQGLAEGTIEWVEDPDFGYQIARAITGVPEELLNPRKYYQAQGRKAEYEEIVAKLRAERREYIRKFEGIDPSIVEAL
jgi:phosphoenolpyruvate carboxykinase (ATP)